jgi:transposase InsO family protein
MTRFIDIHREEFGVEPICTLLQVAPSTSYAQRTRPLAARARRDAQLRVEIRRVWDANYQVSGARKIWRQLGREYIQVGRDHVARLMGELGIGGVVGGAKRRTPPRPPATSARPIWSTATSLPRPPIACGSPISPMWPPGPGSLMWRLSLTPSPA